MVELRRCCADRYQYIVHTRGRLVQMKVAEQPQLVIKIEHPCR